MPLASAGFLRGLAYGINVLIIAIGVRFIVRPDAGATGYGIRLHAGQPRAYAMAKGVRDIAMGIIGLLLLTQADSWAAGLHLLGGSLVAFGDAGVVLNNGGAVDTAFGVHFSTAVVVAMVGALLLGV